MSTPTSLTQTPVQITDGSNSAHITVVSGILLYADDANSPGWHYLNGSVLEIRSPVQIYLKSFAPGGADVIVTTWSES